MAVDGTTSGHSAREAKETAERKQAFLAAFAEHVTVLSSCKAAGVGRSTVYRWRDEDQAFADAFAEVDDANVEQAEAVLYELAVTGHERREYDREGNLLAEYTERDPQLLKFFLQARRPNTYRDRSTVEHTGPGGGPVQVDLSGLTTAELEQLEAINAKLSPPSAA